jgi:signal transduction histidine kinase
LEGVDDGWVDPGTRREAFYTGLKPGSYRFRLMAANDDGVWNRRGATLEFEIPPTFFQSWPFRLLCGLLALGLLWLAYSLRLRAVSNRIRQRLIERMDERERIARDLHDTLLQSVQTLTLRFQMAVDDLREEEPARRHLEQSIDRADQVIAEGRDRLRDLRPVEDGADIAVILSAIVARQRFDPAIEISLATVGTPRTLDPLVLDETARIAGEAIFNVWRHAGAKRVEIEIGFRASFSVRVGDDGMGVDPEILNKGGRQGHFGLPGMRERAKKLRGELIIRRRPEGGTEVMLMVPGAVAYGTGKGRLMARLLRWR